MKDCRDLVFVQSGAEDLPHRVVVATTGVVINGDDATPLGAVLQGVPDLGAVANRALVKDRIT